MEDAMKPFASFAAMLTVLVVVLTITPTWGQSFNNPTITDGHGNTAGGSNALGTCLAKTVATCSSVANTAFGDNALFANTAGDDNTATGSQALNHNTTGSLNTATGGGALY